MTKLIVALLVAVTACGKSTCKDATQHLIDVAFKASKSSKLNQQVGDSIAGACERDGWPRAVTDCMATATTVPALHACEAMLTREQLKAYVEAAAVAYRDAPAEISDIDQLSGEDTIKQITDQQLQMCACTNAACAEATDRAWKVLKRASERARHDEAIKTRFNQIDDQRFQCYLKLTGKK